jgi:hypothetical protein
MINIFNCDDVRVGWDVEGRGGFTAASRQIAGKRAPTPSAEADRRIGAEADQRLWPKRILMPSGF